MYIHEQFFGETEKPTGGVEYKEYSLVSTKRIAGLPLQGYSIFRGDLGNWKMRSTVMKSSWYVGVGPGREKQTKHYLVRFPTRISSLIHSGRL